MAKPEPRRGFTIGVELVPGTTLLGQMALYERSGQPARLLRLTQPATPVDAVSIETGPQDTWWAIEDLLLRLAMHCAITVQQHDGVQVIVHGLRHLTQGSPGELRRAALDADTYQCHRNGRRLAFVRTIAFVADDLTLDLTPMRAVERWDEGDDLPWQMRAFLVRLIRKARVPRPA